MIFSPAPICTHCPPGKCPRSRPAGGGQRLTSKSSGRKTGPRSGEPEKSPEAWSTLFASTVKPAGSRRLRWAPEPSRSLPGSAERPCGGRPEKATLPPSWKLLRLALQPNCLMHFAATTTPARYSHQLIENFTFPGTFVSLSFPSCQLQRIERGRLRECFSQENLGLVVGTAQSNRV